MDGTALDIEQFQAMVAKDAPGVRRLPANGNDEPASERCTPEQDLETVRVLLDASADPCVGPEDEHEYDPLVDAPEWDPPAIGIAAWNKAPEIVALVEAAAADCTP